MNRIILIIFIVIITNPINAQQNQIVIDQKFITIKNCFNIETKGSKYLYLTITNRSNNNYYFWIGREIKTHEDAKEDIHKYLFRKPNNKYEIPFGNLMTENAFFMIIIMK